MLISDHVFMSLIPLWLKIVPHLPAGIKILLIWKKGGNTEQQDCGEVAEEK